MTIIITTNRFLRLQAEKTGMLYSVTVDCNSSMLFIHTVEILTGGLSMDMVAGSTILVEYDGQGDPSLAARGSTERNF